jgi:hypothetical protein
LTTKRTQTTRPLRSSPITGPSPLLRGGPPPCRASVLSPSQFQLLGVLPSARRRQHTGQRHHGEGFPRFALAPEPGSRHLCAGQPPGQQTGIPLALPGATTGPRLRLPSLRLRHFSSGSLTFAFPVPTWRITCAFSVVLITPAHSPAQPTVVCSLPLQGGCGGPASITSTTPQPSARSPTSPPPVAFVAHHRPRSGPARRTCPAKPGPAGAGTRCRARD